MTDCGRTLRQSQPVRPHGSYPLSDRYPLPGACVASRIWATLAPDSLGERRCSIFRTCSSGTASTEPPRPKSEENQNALILLGRFKAAAMGVPMFNFQDMFQWDRFITPSIIKGAYLLVVG